MRSARGSTLFRSDRFRSAIRRSKRPAVEASFGSSFQHPVTRMNRCHILAPHRQRRVPRHGYKGVASHPVAEEAYSWYFSLWTAREGNHVFDQCLLMLDYKTFIPEKSMLGFFPLEGSCSLACLRARLRFSLLSFVVRCKISNQIYSFGYGDIPPLENIQRISPNYRLLAEFRRISLDKIQ